MNRTLTLYDREERSFNDVEMTDRLSNSDYERISFVTFLDDIEYIHVPSDGYDSSDNFQEAIYKERH